ncbi:hypothetical protein JCM8547_000764 [Rhodosporidiobolus lusitaniae]
MSISRPPSTRSSSTYAFNQNASRFSYIPSPTSDGEDARDDEPPVICFDCQHDGQPRGGRRLVLFFDGTCNSLRQNITSLPTLRSFVPNNRTQLTYYQGGIGTAISGYSPATFIAKAYKGAAKVADAVWGRTLEEHICGGYRWLMDHYQEGDQIFLFGFSRGAYTARALAGMLEQVGLLPSGNGQNIARAYDIYKKTEEGALEALRSPYPPTSLFKSRDPLLATKAAHFKHTFGREIHVHFVGAWDTVSTVDFIPTNLPFTSSSGHIHHFRQALALDERRGDYAEQPWRGPREEPPMSTQVKEVYFAGSHSDVGGKKQVLEGHTESSLSYLSLRWMVREALAAGLVLDPHRILESPIFKPFIPTYDTFHYNPPLKQDVDRYVGMVQELNGSTPFDVLRRFASTVFLAASPQSIEIAMPDVLAPVNDPLSFGLDNLSLSEKAGALRTRVKEQGLAGAANPLLWKSAEKLYKPQLLWSTEKRKNVLHLAHRNNGAGRTLPSLPVFHWSVEARMMALQAARKPYVPAAKLENGEEVTLETVQSHTIEQ